MARKPLSEKTVAENCLKWGTGGINIDESRVEGKLEGDPNRFSKTDGGSFNKFSYAAPVVRNEGRFPANLIHDNSEEVRECFPETGKSRSGGKGKPLLLGEGLKDETTIQERGGYDDNDGNASRFFKSIIYQAKASKSERNKGCEELEEKVGIRTNAPRENEDIKTPTRTNNHPTVKPISLMRYLCRLVTPKGGTVLDPFMGSGSTGIAAKLEGFNFIGIEIDPEYVSIANARIAG